MKSVVPHNSTSCGKVVPGGDPEDASVVAQKLQTGNSSSTIWRVIQTFTFDSTTISDLKFQNKKWLLFPGTGNYATNTTHTSNNSN